MSRRAKIRWISYLAAFYAVMISALAACHIGAGGFETRIDAQSSRCFGETLSAVNKLDSSLRKCSFASGHSMKTILCAQIYSDAQSVQTSLSMLPVQMDALENISKQIAVMGDYAFTLASSEMEGIMFSDDEIQQFSAFAAVTENLQKQLETLHQAYEGHTLVHEQRLRLTDSLNNLEEQSAAAIETLDDAFHRIKAGVPSADLVHYDGQYSDCEDLSSGVFCEEQPVNQSQALYEAAAFLGIASDHLKPLDSSEGEMPCWRFSVQDKLKGVISVSVHGGHVVRFLSDESSNDDLMDRVAAAAACSTFLKAHGYQNMVVEPASSEAQNDAICFVAEQSGVLCLSDRIVMRADLSTGEIISFNAEDYLRHHHSRQFQVFDVDDLRSSLPENASVKDVKSVLMQSPGGKECLCAAFLCQMPNGETARVYVNAETGEQMQILLENETETSLF